MRKALFLKSMLAAAAVVIGAASLSPQPTRNQTDLDAAIELHLSRAEAAQAALVTKPLIGESHLPPFDAEAARAQEEAEVRRLRALRDAARR